MPYCSKCGKPVTVAPIICSECQKPPAPEAAEAIMQKLCDEYCRWPRKAIEQEAEPFPKKRTQESPEKRNETQLFSVLWQLDDKMV